MNAYEWLQQVQVGEPAVVIQVTPAPKFTARWVELRVEVGEVTRVSASHVTALQRRFRRRFTAKEEYGRSRDGAKIRPASELESWQLAERRNRAWNALAPYAGGLPGLRHLQMTVIDDGTELSRHEDTVAALERVLALVQEIEVVTKGASVDLERRIREYWAKV